jgi:hypothetical protein
LQGGQGELRDAQGGQGECLACAVLTKKTGGIKIRLKKKKANLMNLKDSYKTK